MKADDNENHWPRGPRDLGRVFRRVVEEVFDELKLDIVRQDGWGYTLADADGKEKQVGLTNLYLRACRNDRNSWPEMIREFLANLDTDPYDDITSAPLADVVEQLLPRVGKPFEQSPGLTPWAKPLCGDDLVANIVIDLPRAMVYVNETKVEESGRPGEEWLERAVANLHAKTPADVFRPLDAGLLLCETNDSYDAARSLVVERVLPPSPAGFLVAMPGRDLLLVLPVSLERVPTLHLIKLVAERASKDIPYAISSDVYWFKDGVMLPFPIRIEAGNVTLSPPAEFIEALNALEPPSDGESAPEDPQ